MRRWLDMTQVEFAAVCGISHSLLEKMERRQRSASKCSLGKLNEIADAALGPEFVRKDVRKSGESIGRMVASQSVPKQKPSALSALLCRVQPHSSAAWHGGARRRWRRGTE